MKKIYKTPKKERERCKEYQRKHPEKIKAYKLKWNKANADKKKQASKEWVLKNSGRHSKTSLIWQKKNAKRDQENRRRYAESGAKNHASRKSKYGITPEKFKQMIKNQKGKCLTCFIKFTGTPHIDHCHKTGKIRGLLCGLCNRALGCAKDDIKILLNMVKYLQGE